MLGISDTSYGLLLAKLTRQDTFVEDHNSVGFGPIVGASLLIVHRMMIVMMMIMFDADDSVDDDMMIIW